MYFLHFLVRVCIDRLGAVSANISEYQYQVPGGLKNVYFDKKNLQLHYVLRTLVQPEEIIKNIE